MQTALRASWAPVTLGTLLALVGCADRPVAMPVPAAPVPDRPAAAVPGTAATPERIRLAGIGIQASAQAPAAAADPVRAWIATGADPVAGAALLAERRERLRRLIVADPQAALAERLTWRERQAVPPQLRHLLEEPVADRAALRSIARLGEDGRTAVIPVADLADGRTLRNHTWGRRAGMHSKGPVAVWGIAIDGDAALSDRPSRPLDPGEPVDGLEAKIGTCPVSALPVDPDPAAAVVAGKTVLYLCSAGHIRPADEQLAAAEGLAPEIPVASPWTTGTKTLLWTVAKFSDQTTNIPTESAGQSCINGTNTWMQTVSYGKMQGFTGTFITVTLPKTTSEYGSDDGLVLTDAKAAAKAAGFDPVDWDHFVVRYNGGPGGFSGQAYVGSPGTWMKTDSVGVACHELGHNLGLWHANYWNASGDTVMGSGSNNEYGNSFDTMGAASAGSNHFNSGSRRLLDWLSDAAIHTVSTSGTYRIFPLDHASELGSAQRQALRVNVPWKLGTYSTNVNYWVEYRRLFTSNRWLSNGVTVKANGVTNFDGGDQLLDTTPGSADGKNDAAVVFGRTYSDSTNGIHITPLGFGGTSPESIDVRVEIGAFAGNQAPAISGLTGPATLALSTAATFAVAATDPDGDPLAYYWQFGDGQLGSNAAAVSKSWSSAGIYPVRVVVSDRKGQVASRTLLVTVGSPTTFTISGTVLDDQGQPVEGVRVHNGQSGGSYRGGFSDSDGTYVIANLAAGSATLAAVKPGYGAIAPGFTNPVTVGPSAISRDFTAVPLPRVSVTAVDALAAEGASDTGTYRVSRTGPTGSALAVTVAISGTATSGTDYSLAPATTTTVTIPAAAASTDVVLTAATDAVTEGDETITLTLQPASGYVLAAPTAATVTIDGVDGPANDAFANRIALAGSNVTTTGSNQFATLEPGEPVHWSSGNTASVWWSWTAPSSGTCAITLAGSTFDTVLAVYTGDALGSLTQIAKNDDSAGTASALSFTAVGSTAYRIAVASYGSGTGTIAFALTHTGSGGNSAPVISGGPAAAPATVVLP
ncbi:MAG: hypothetical protein RLZZ127_382 [Planctomycetota bacterium]|jgi:hypothetical protein